MITSTAHTIRNLPGGLIAVLDDYLLPDFEDSSRQVLAEMPPGLSTLVVLTKWKPAPLRGEREDDIVSSFVCTSSVLQDLREIDTDCPPDQLCYSLLEAILNGILTVDRILVRQLPYPLAPLPAVAEAASVVMAHRGRYRHLDTSLYYLTRAEHAEVRVRVGLDCEPAEAYEELARRYPQVEFYNLQPAPLGPYVIRQELASRSPEPLMAFHDSDDVSCHDRFSALCGEMRRTGCDLIGSHELRVDEIRRCVLAVRFPLDASAALRLGYDHALLHPTSMVKRASFFAAGGFSTNHPISGDMQFLLRAYFSLNIRNADGFLYIRRRHPAALTVAPETNMQAPLRVRLNRAWRSSFWAVKSGDVRLEDSDLWPIAGADEYRLLPLKPVGSEHTQPLWCAEEVSQAVTLRRAIDACSAPRRKMAGYGTIRIQLSAADQWKQDLIEAERIVLVRQLFHALRLDEHRPFQWRLEHKLVQSLVLDQFCPGCVPVTRGLIRLAHADGPEGLLQSLERDFAAGFFVKPALGDSSGDHGIQDASEAALAAFLAAPLPDCPRRLEDETWIVQEKVPIEVEYRVHSVEDRAIDDLTLRRYGTGDIPGERDAPNAFVQRLLDRLPGGIVGGSMLGWDVARTPAGAFVVIEVNFAGFHPVHRRGFQCSGYFINEEWGAKSIAHWIRFMEKSDGFQIELDADVQEESKERTYYEQVTAWKERLLEAERTGQTQLWLAGGKGKSGFASAGKKGSKALSKGGGR
ncbi:MAG TPA: hypothetical protein VEU96_23230 [Bryobacteraceae bacterium]|nr:hypothetical protein [Bryobacteraceae bacterium]